MNTYNINDMANNLLPYMYTKVSMDIQKIAHRKCMGNTTMSSPPLESGSGRFIGANRKSYEMKPRCNRIGPYGNTYQSEIDHFFG